jgi:hypothetical protein
LLKPANRTAQVRAVNGKHLELVASDAPHPACGVGGLAVVGIT